MELYVYRYMFLVLTILGGFFSFIFTIVYMVAKWGDEFEDDKAIIIVKDMKLVHPVILASTIFLAILTSQAFK